METINVILKSVKSQSMRDGLMGIYERLDEKKRAAERNLSDNLRYLGYGETGDADKRCAMDIQGAADAKREHDEACGQCAFTAYDCDKCKYNGSDFHYFMMVNMYARRAIKSCAKYRAWKEKKRLSRIMGESGLGDRFLSRTFETFRPTAATKAAYDTCLAFCDTFTGKSRGLMLMGNCGCGKTHLAAAIIARLAEKGIAGFFVVVPEMLARIRAGFSSGDESTNDLVSTARESELLVLDDLGAEKESEWVKEQLYMLINYRYEHTLPTIITTNYNGERLEKELGRRTMSRLVEMTKPVVIKAADYRMTKAV